MYRICQMENLVKRVVEDVEPNVEQNVERVRDVENHAVNHAVEDDKYNIKIYIIFIFYFALQCNVHLLMILNKQN
jgi:hypothetical protein